MAVRAELVEAPSFFGGDVAPLGSRRDRRGKKRRREVVHCKPMYGYLILCPRNSGIPQYSAVHSLLLMAVSLINAFLDLIVKFIHRLKMCKILNFSEEVRLLMLTQLIKQ
jgi:hypothetical protein